MVRTLRALALTPAAITADVLVLAGTQVVLAGHTLGSIVRRCA